MTNVITFTQDGNLYYGFYPDGTPAPCGVEDRDGLRSDCEPDARFRATRRGGERHGGETEFFASLEEAQDWAALVEDPFISLKAAAAKTAGAAGL